MRTDTRNHRGAATLLALLTLFRRNEVRLFLTSLAILFVELLLIRWIPSNVKYIGFFSNFLLIASFLGIGLGILIGRKGFNPRISPFAILLAAVVIYVFNVPAQRPDQVGRRAVLRPRREQRRRPELPDPAADRRPGRRAAGDAGTATRAAAQEHAAAQGVRDRHHRLARRHRQRSRSCLRSGPTRRLVHGRTCSSSWRSSLDAEAVDFQRRQRRRPGRRAAPRVPADRRSQLRHLVAVLPDQRSSVAAASSTSRRRHSAPGAPSAR